MVKEIVVLRDTGIPLFHYSVSGTRQLDEIVSAFLSAIGSMAEHMSKEKITVMEFAENKFVWVYRGDLYFIALVAERDSEEIYRVVLQELYEQFVKNYYDKLASDSVRPREFEDFLDVVELTLQKFSGVPGLARRYKTALLPTEEIRLLRKSIKKTEEHPFIKRIAIIIQGGHIIFSDFTAYELEDILDIISDFNSGETKNPIMIDHPALDEGDSFFISKTHECVHAYIVESGKDIEDYMQLVKIVRNILHEIDFRSVKLMYPSKRDEILAFYEYDVLVPLMPVERVLQNAKVIFGSLSSKLRSRATGVLRLIDDTTTIIEIQEEAGLTRSESDEVIAHLISKGIVRVASLFPLLEEKDERFTAYLEVIGIPKNNYDILNSIWRYCDSQNSVKEIAKKTGTPASRIIEVLRTLGKQVKWVKRPGVK
ncbi:MAG: hypothetical protein GF411_13715 [Candidatus Lokiarchaeota archaeon]|nr:hypothetical protein [Candidatus Lokiarchaeota archaeon]